MSKISIALVCRIAWDIYRAATSAGVAIGHDLQKARRLSISFTLAYVAAAAKPGNVVNKHGFLPVALSIYPIYFRLIVLLDCGKKY